MEGSIPHRVDLFDAAGRLELLRRVQPEVLVHLAWDVRHGEYWTSTSNLRWVSASLELIDQFFRLGGERVVMAGTCAEYDWQQGQPSATFGEDHPIRPSTLYGAAKAACYTLMEQVHDVHGHAFAWPRVFFPYGPGEDPRRLVPSIIRQLLRGEAAETALRDEQRDFLYIGDVGRAVTAITLSDVRGAVNVGSGVATSVERLAQLLGELTGRRDLLDLVGSRVAQGRDPVRIVADITRLRQDVGFTPTVSLEAGLLSSVEWWKSSPRA
jgi:nucleoside-diphosphate-sugar epimerase